MSDSGQVTCAKIQKMKEDQKKSQKLLDTMTSVATLGMNQVFDTGMDIKLPKDDRAVNILKNNYKKIKETISSNLCQNIQDVSQSNEYIQPSLCYTAINKNCEDIMTGEVDQECLRDGYRFVDNFSNKLITMDNRNNQRAQCEINSIIGVLSEEEQNLENLALIKLLQEKYQKAKNDGDECTEISSDVTDKQYIASFLTCANKSYVKQKNVINDCLPVIDSQKNINIDIKKCLNESGIYNDVKQKSNIESSSVTMSKDPTPSPSDDSSLITEQACIIIGIIISILLLGGIGLAMFRKAPSNVVYLQPPM
jgi:hypothetical protein